MELVQVHGQMLSLFWLGNLVRAIELYYYILLYNIYIIWYNYIHGDDRLRFNIDPISQWNVSHCDDFKSLAPNKPKGPADFNIDTILSFL